MRSSFAFALCLAALFCSARALPSGFEIEVILQGPKSYSLEGFDDGRAGFRKLLQDNELNVALLVAAFQGNAAVVQAALNRGANPNFVDDEGKRTPLIAAAGKNHAEVVRVLTQGGATVDLRTSQGFTALEFAAVLGSTEAAKALLEAGADPNHEDDKGLTPVHRASIEGNVETVKALVEGGGDFERKTAGETSGQTALIIAAVRGHLGLIKYLISVGANVNVETNRGRISPLHFAAVGNFGGIVQVLLGAGAEIDKRNENGITPLGWAAFFGRQQSIEILLDAGADKGAKDSGGNSVRDVLCQCIFSSEVSEDCNVEGCDSPARMIQLLS